MPCTGCCNRELPRLTQQWRNTGPAVHSTCRLPHPCRCHGRWGAPAAPSPSSRLQRSSVMSESSPPYLPPMSEHTGLPTQYFYPKWPPRFPRHLFVLHHITLTQLLLVLESIVWPPPSPVNGQYPAPPLPPSLPSQRKQARIYSARRAQSQAPPRPSPPRAHA